MAISLYKHVQGAASTTWNINHNMNESVVIVDCWTNDGGVDRVIHPSSVEIVDSNNITVKFSQAYAGEATVV